MPSSLFLRRLAGAVVLAGSSACAPVRTLPLSRPVAADAADVRLTAASVSPSPWFLAQRGSSMSVIAVSIQATNAAAEDRVLDLDRARLVLRDPGGELPDVFLVPMSGGEGEVRDVVPFRDAPRPRVLRGSERAAFWIAFRAEEPLPEPDLPRRIVLRVPVASGPDIELVLAEPATARPRWVDAPVTSASYAGVSAMGTTHEGSFGILRVAPRSVAGPAVLGPTASLGLRGGHLRRTEGASIACCDLGLGFNVSFPFRAPNDQASFGPYLGYQALIALDRDRADRDTWHGVAIGAQMFSDLLYPRTAGAFPVRKTPSVLGYSAFTIAFVEWMRAGDTASPGAMFLFEHTTPEF